MANVNAFVKIAESIISTQDYSQTSTLATIPDVERPRPFRGRSVADIETILHALTDQILAVVNDLGIHYTSVQFASSPVDNRSLADALLVLDNDKTINIELKFGSETTANVGMETVNSLLPTPNSFDFLSNKVRKLYKERIVNQSTLESAVAGWDNYIHSHLMGVLTDMSLQGYKLTSEQCERLNTIINQSGRSDVVQKDPYIKAIVGNSKITTKIVEPLSVDDWELTIDYNARLNLMFESSVGSVRMTLNNKNDQYIQTDEGRLKVRSKHLLGSPSLNVWYTPYNAPEAHIFNFSGSLVD